MRSTRRAASSALLTCLMLAGCSPTSLGGSTASGSTKGQPKATKRNSARVALAADLPTTVLANVTPPASITPPAGPDTRRLIQHMEWVTVTSGMLAAS